MPVLRFLRIATHIEVPMSNRQHYTAYLTIVLLNMDSSESIQETAMTIMDNKPTSLHNIIQSNSHDAKLQYIRLLLNNTCIDINALDDHGYTALYYAAEMYQHGDIVKLLLQHAHIDVNVATQTMHTTALMRAVTMNCTRNVRHLVQHKDTNVNMCANGYGASAISLIVYTRKDEVLLTARQLVNHEKINVNHMNKYGQTIMHDSWMKGSYHVFALLMHGRV
jgi:ankyrin repeat protein